MKSHNKSWALKFEEFKKVTQRAQHFCLVLVRRQSNFDAYFAAHSPTLHLEDGEYTGTHRPKMKMKGKVGLNGGHDSDYASPMI